MMRGVKRVIEIYRKKEKGGKGKREKKRKRKRARERFMGVQFLLYLIKVSILHEHECVYQHVCEHLSSSYINIYDPSLDSCIT